MATKCASHEWSLLSSASETGGINDPDFVDQDGRLLKHLARMKGESPTSHPSEMLSEPLNALLVIGDKTRPSHVTVVPEP